MPEFRAAGDPGKQYLAICLSGGGELKRKILVCSRPHANGSPFLGVSHEHRLEQLYPWQAASGGVLIGLGSVALVLWNGRIAGISGILGGLVSRVEGDLAGVSPSSSDCRQPLAMGGDTPRQPAKRQLRAGNAGRMGAAGDWRPAGRLWDASRQGVHQRPRRLWPCTLLAALAAGGRRLHGRWRADRLRHPPCRGIAT